MHQYERQLLQLWHVARRVDKNLEPGNVLQPVLGDAQDFGIHLILFDVALGLVDKDVDVGFRLEPITLFTTDAAAVHVMRHILQLRERGVDGQMLEGIGTEQTQFELFHTHSFLRRGSYR